MTDDQRIHDLVEDIKGKIADITSGEIGMIVYLKNASYHDNSRGSTHNIITVSCVFINDDGNLCADLFRTGAAGFMECLYGNIVSGMGLKGVEVIYSAINEGRWYLAETPKKNDYEKKVKQKKRLFNIPFKFHCLMKGF